MLVNVVDVPPLCNFILPAIVRTGPLAIAISTAGASPALAKRIKREIAAEVRARARRAPGRAAQRRARVGEAGRCRPTRTARRSSRAIVNGDPDPIALLRAGDEDGVRALILAAQRSHEPAPSAG